MKLKKIQWRNIGPFGNTLQQIALPDGGGFSPYRESAFDVQPRDWFQRD